jgi:hypothetical protein
MGGGATLLDYDKHSISSRAFRSTYLLTWLPSGPSSSYRGVSQTLRRGPAVNASAMKLQPGLYAFGRRALHVRRLHEYELDRGAGSREGCRPVRVWHRDLRLLVESKPQAGIPLARAGFCLEEADGYASRSTGRIVRAPDQGRVLERGWRTERRK